MKKIFLRTFASLAVFVVGGLSANSYAGWFDVDDSISVVESKKPGANAAAVKNAATIRITGYVDGRDGATPKKIGITTQRVLGIAGKDVVLDRVVTEIVANSIRKHFDDAGFQFVESSALYELSGVVKDLTYNVKARDEISIAVETTLKDTATGKVIWSGLVQEKTERFAGISGNNKSDIANVLRYELGIVSQKTVDAISASLMASRPDLFTLTPGTKAIAGVTVLQAVGGGAAALNSVPAAPAQHVAVTGTLVLNTKPARAKVYLDGVYYGMSPLRAEVEAGVHEVSVKVTGYKTASEKLSVRKGEVTELELVLER
jgi:hypothetical protein